MREIIIHILILFGIPTIFFLAGSTLNGIREILVDDAARHGAKKNTPWFFAIMEGLLCLDLMRKGIITWLIKHLIKSLQPYVDTPAYTYVFAGFMALALLIFFLRRRKHIVWEFLLGLLRIPLDIVCIITIGTSPSADKYPPELGYRHNMPKNIAQKEIIVKQPVAGSSGSSTGQSTSSASSGTGYSQTSSGGSSEAPGITFERPPVYVPEKYLESYFVPDDDYYTAKTTDGQTVYYKDADYRPFVDGGLDDISHHES